MEYTGAQDIPVAEKPAVTDHVDVTVKGPAADFTFEIFFARDAARTPLLIKIPLSVGTVLAGAGALKCAWRFSRRCRRRAAASPIIPKP